MCLTKCLNKPGQIAFRRRELVKIYKGLPFLDLLLAFLLLVQILQNIQAHKIKFRYSFHPGDLGNL